MIRRTPEIRVFDGPGGAADEAAERISRVLRRRPSGVLVLASGKPMVPVYRGLVRRQREGRGSFAKAMTFNLDELAVPAADPRSFRSFMDRHLFSRVDLEKGRIRFLRGNARDAAAECARYEDDFARAGPADLALVGIGPNGHVAYLEPGESLAPVTSSVRLSAETRRTLAADGVLPPPRRALTMGIETILSAVAILLVATGRSKAEAVANALRGPVTARCPASYLSLHPRLTILLDRAAAREL